MPAAVVSKCLAWYDTMYAKACASTGTNVYSTILEQQHLTADDCGSVVLTFSVEWFQRATTES